MKNGFHVIYISCININFSIEFSLNMSILIIVLFALGTVSYSLNIPSTVNAHRGALHPKVHYIVHDKDILNIIAELYFVIPCISKGCIISSGYSECLRTKTQYTHLWEMVLVALGLYFFISVNIIFRNNTVQFKHWQGCSKLCFRTHAAFLTQSNLSWPKRPKGVKYKVN